MKKKIRYTDEPKDGFELPEEGFEILKSDIGSKKLKSLAVENVPYDKRFVGGKVRLLPRRGGARAGAGRKPSGHVRLQLSVSPSTRRKIEAIAKLRNLTLSQAVEEMAAMA